MRREEREKGGMKEIEDNYSTEDWREGGQWLLYSKAP